MKRELLILIASSFLWFGNAFAASFDCTKAKSFSEKTICSNTTLSNEDDDLKYLYAKAKSYVQDRKAFSEITKTLWNSRERCSDFACVNAWYDTAFAIYGAIAKTGIPETNGVNDVLKNSNDDYAVVTPQSDDEKINKRNNGDVVTVQPKVTYQLENESKFSEAIKKSIKEVDSAKNDMQIGGIKSTRDKEICNILSIKSVSNWIGEVKQVSANSDGKGVLVLSVPGNALIRTWNNSFSDIRYNTLIEPGTKLFNDASQLNPGDIVSFSGTFFEDEENCISEASLSLSGKVKEPEFIFRFSDIRKYQQ